MAAAAATKKADNDMRPNTPTIQRSVLLPPRPGNPRNSEGDFIALKDGRLMFVYSHFVGEGGDHDKAHLAAWFSDDGGKTWTEKDVIVVPNEGGFNVMSVSLLRLASGEIALFYLRKNSLSDCRPVMRLSRDEAKTWGPPAEVIADEIGYYVMNNDRVVQLGSGRLVAPVALHKGPDAAFTSRGKAMCYLSDDGGKTWRRSRTVLVMPEPLESRSGLQEPGVVELKEGRLMLFARTDQGSQYLSYSNDGGETWSAPQPSAIRSPTSPASIERIPKTGDLLLVWNDNFDPKAGWSAGARTPFNAAVSSDEGKTWKRRKVLEEDPDGWYCYTAIEFVGDRVLLGHCGGDRRKGGLNTTQITAFDVDWLYR